MTAKQTATKRVAMIAAVVAAGLVLGIGANPRKIEELQTGGGYGETVNGGADFEADGDFLTDGDITANAVTLGSTLLIPDDVDLVWGTDSDIRARYDEAGDNRLEFHDGTNLLGYLTDAGTTGNWGVTGTLNVTGAATFNADSKFVDDKALIVGTDSDIHYEYDEITDNRAEWSDGTNLLAYLTDAGTTGNLGVTGTATVTGGTATISTAGATDAILSFLTNTGGTGDGVDVFLDESTTYDNLVVEGKTAAVTTYLDVRAKSGYAGGFNLWSGSVRSENLVNSAGEYLIRNRSTSDKISFWATTVTPTLTEFFRIDPDNGIYTYAVPVTISHDLAVNGGDLTSTGNLTINPNSGAGKTLFTGGVLASNSGITIDLDDDNDGVNLFQIRSGADATALSVTEGGIVSATSNLTTAGVFYTSTITTFAANDTTPAVSAGNVFVVPGTWTAGNNITALDGGVGGQSVVIIGGDSDCVVVDGAALTLAGNWTAAADASLRVVYTGAAWIETSRSAN